MIYTKYNNFQKSIQSNRTRIKRKERIYLSLKKNDKFTYKNNLFSRCTKGNKNDSYLIIDIEKNYRLVIYEKTRYKCGKNK